MNTRLQRTPLLPFLLGLALLLPACGSKTVKSEPTTETVLDAGYRDDAGYDPYSSGTADTGIDEGGTSVNTYIAKIKPLPTVEQASTIPTGSLTALPTAAETATDGAAPVMESAAPPPPSGGGFPDWLLWVLLVVALGGAVGYIWNKRRKSQDLLPDGQPMPPVGGLSPVSGFMSAKGRPIEEDGPKGSFWTKKLF